MRQMQPDEIRTFLLSGTRTAKLATVRPDGRPHVAPIWFDLDDDGALVFTTWHTSVKAVNLRHSPLLSLCVDDETPPFAFVLVEGRAEISEDLVELRTWATRIARRYMGPEQADAYGTRNGVAGELLVRVRPSKLIGQAGVAD